jgi:hypothetical protein
MQNENCKWKDVNGISRKAIPGLVASFIILIVILMLPACNSGDTPPPTFPTSSNADLSFYGSLDQPFSPDRYDYTATVDYNFKSLQITPVTSASVSINNTAAVLSVASQPVSLGVGSNLITITVRATDGITTQDYSVMVERFTKEILQQAYLKASNTEVDDNFGYSVSLSGDTLAIAATGEDSNATGVNGNQADNSAASAGAVYVFQ